MLNLYPWIGLAAASGGAFAALVNVTIDDTDPSIVYSPPNDWSFGPTCTACTAKVDASKTFNGSWHDTLFSSQDYAENFTQTIEFAFNGTAVYVFGILSNAMSNPSGNADYLIYIDGDETSNFVHKATGDGTFVYKSPLYANASLPNGNHTLKVQNGKPNDQSSFILFDYIIYSADNGNSTQPGTSTFSSSSAIPKASSSSPSSSLSSSTLPTSSSVSASALNTTRSSDASTTSSAPSLTLVSTASSSVPTTSLTSDVSPSSTPSSSGAQSWQKSSSGNGSMMGMLILFSISLLSY